MLDAIISTLSLGISSCALLVFPGWFVIRVVLSLKNLSSWETALFSLGLSIGILDITLLLLDRFGITLDRIPITSGIVGLLTVLFFLQKMWSRYRNVPPIKLSHEPKVPGSFSRTEGYLLLVMIIITVFIRSLALLDTALPSATDLGHHMYWVQKITLEQAIPTYEKIDLQRELDGSLVLTQAHPIADFIVGEHLPIATLSVFTNLSVFSALPPLFLVGINIASIFSCLLLAWSIGKEMQAVVPRFKPTLFVLVTFFLLGPLYSLASPQMKFVTGGVIGNLLGNLFIPLILFAFFRTLKDQSARFLGIGIFLSFILAYTHHLSTLVLFFILLGISGSLILLNPTALKTSLVTIWKILRQPTVLMLLATLLGFMIFVALPSYLQGEAIDSAIGTPTKTTRTGLSFFQVTNSVGLAKLAFGLAGLVLLSFFSWRKTLGGNVLIGWTSMLMIMTLFPHFLLLDIPSNRIGSYLIYPLALTGAWLLVWITNEPKAAHLKFFRIPFLSVILFSLLGLVFLSTNGWYENGGSYPDRSFSSEALLETFRGSAYLADHIPDNSIVLKDHNYIVGDAWIKLFFHRDYNFPLSRGFFSRYTEGGSRREQCTLIMISAPNTPEAARCFRDTDTEFLMVNPKIDSAQFEKSSTFSKIFTGSSLAVYSRLP